VAEVAEVEEGAEMAGLGSAEVEELGLVEADSGSAEVADLGWEEGVGWGLEGVDSDPAGVAVSDSVDSVVVKEASVG